MPDDLRGLGEAFTGERDDEYDRCRRSLPPAVVSPYNPPLTTLRDRERRRGVREHMRRWAARWWADRGYRMIVVDEATDSFRVEPSPGPEMRGVG